MTRKSLDGKAFAATIRAVVATLVSSASQGEEQGITPPDLAVCARGEEPREPGSTGAASKGRQTLEAGMKELSSTGWPADTPRRDLPRAGRTDSTGTLKCHGIPCAICRFPAQPSIPDLVVNGPSIPRKRTSTASTSSNRRPSRDLSEIHECPARPRLPDACCRDHLGFPRRCQTRWCSGVDPLEHLVGKPMAQASSARTRATVHHLSQQDQGLARRHPPRRHRRSPPSGGRNSCPVEAWIGGVGAPVIDVGKNVWPARATRRAWYTKFDFRRSALKRRVSISPSRAASGDDHRLPGPNTLTALRPPPGLQEPTGTDRRRPHGTGTA